MEIKQTNARLLLSIIVVLLNCNTNSEIPSNDIIRCHTLFFITVPLQVSSIL